MRTNKRKQGDGTVRLRKDGRWEGRIIVDYDEKGNPKGKRVFAKTKTECEEKLRKLKKSLGKSVERFNPEMPFGEWMDFWYQTFCKPALRETTKASYENIIYNHIIPSVGQIPLNKLSQNDLQQFYARLKRQGRLQYADKFGTGMSDRMVRCCHARCRSALEKAIAERLITKNPSLGCKLPPKKSREMQILTPNEIMRFLARAKEEGYYEMFLLELSTGMRRGEILGLKWSDLNMSDGSLRIARQVVVAGKQVLVQTPKTKSSIRTVILPPYMLEQLAELKKNKTCDWMFPSPVKEGEVRNPTAIHRRFKLILERAGCKNIRFHDLRHTFATMALENGMDVKTLSGIIGHISAETTLNIYSHITDTMRLQASVKIDRKIGGTNAPMPESKNEPSQTRLSENDTVFEAYKPKIRKSGTGGLYQISENLWEGSFYPRLPDGTRKKFNVYAKTKAECEEKLAKMIAEKKAEIAKQKKAQKRVDKKSALKFCLNWKKEYLLFYTNIFTF